MPTNDHHMSCYALCKFFIAILAQVLYVWTLLSKVLAHQYMFDSMIAFFRYDSVFLKCLLLE